MSEIKVNKISPRTACGTTTLGDSGDTFTIPAGVTITNNGTQIILELTEQLIGKQVQLKQELLLQQVVKVILSIQVEEQQQPIYQQDLLEQ